jgi:hypothetical protein
MVTFLDSNGITKQQQQQQQQQREQNAGYVYLVNSLHLV